MEGKPEVIQHSLLFNRSHFPLSALHSKMKRPSGNFDIDKYVKRVLPASWLHCLPLPISWFFGYRRNAPRKRSDVIIYLWTWIGAFCGVSVIEAVFQRNPYFSDRGVPLIVGSFVNTLKLTQLLMIFRVRQLFFFTALSRLRLLNHAQYFWDILSLLLSVSASPNFSKPTKHGSGNCDG